VIAANKEGTAYWYLIRYQEQLMDRALNSLGRVA
jgi:hypothetical protein